MPFGACLKIFKKSAGDLAEQYGGAKARNLVEDGVERIAESDGQSGKPGIDGAFMGELVQAFSSKQQVGIQDLFGALGGSVGGLENRASEKGMDPALIQGIIGMLTGSGSPSAGVPGASGGGFNFANLLQVAQSLTKGGSDGGGGAGGFMNLLSGAGGGAGGGAASSNNILTVLVGLAKSFFAMQSGKNRALQDWGTAGANKNKDDGNFTSWAMNLIKDLLFPGKKQKDTINVDPGDQNTGGKDKVKGWFDNHPEIGKMQKDVFDDIFDTTDDEKKDDDDPAPLIPTPVGFSPDCSALDNASILFLNTNVLLDLRKQWRFLYSTKTHERSYADFLEAIQYQGPTLVIVRSADGSNMLGAFASTSWAPTQGGWIGNGDSFVFSIKPKMAVFYATGKDENFMYLDENSGIGMGGAPGHFGFGLSSSMDSASYHEEVITFDLPNIFENEIDANHIEAWGLGAAPDPHAERSKVHIRKPNRQMRGGNVDMDDLMDQIS